jgi:hypothetical protein
MDSICDDVSTDTSSTRSSYQDPSTFEEVVSSSDSEENDNNFVKGSEGAIRGVDSVASQGSSIANSNSIETESLFNNKDRFFRNDYINKLTNMKVIRPQPKSKPHQTLVIFDWDDTLFPTSFLSYVGFEKVQSDIKLQKSLSKIDKHVSKLLHKAVRFGKTCIVTNASQNWVETSSETYLPHTYAFIKKMEVTVISARAKYEKQFPNEPKRWKQEAFLALKENLEGSVLTNIISIGDSTLELEAAQHVCRVLDQALLKTIKFKEGPRIEELSKQQEVVLEKFDQIYMTLKSLTIKVEKKN